MEQQLTEQLPAPKIKKTADRAAYMRAYRLANLEKCREQDRRQYHANKPTNYEAKRSEAERKILNALLKYPEILDTLLDGSQ
jgi:hypothetical protein